MIYAFIASMFRDEYTPKRGIGKTLSMVYYLYQKSLENKRIITNFYTPFSEVMNITDIIIGILNNTIDEAEIGLTEFQTVLDNLGHKQLKKRIWRLVVSQSRKLGLNFYLDMQILRQIDNDARDHIDYIIRPQKRHRDMSICNKDSCDYPYHRIILYSIIPALTYSDGTYKPMKKVLKAENVGKLYDSKRITVDPIIISKLKPYAHLFDGSSMKEFKEKKEIM